MQRSILCLSALSALLIPSFVAAQTSSDTRAVTPTAASAPTAVPALIPYASTALSVEGKPLTGEASATFLIFKEEAGGEPLWVETQMISADKAGQYAVKLGASSPSGVPLEVFAKGTARWLEVQISGQRPQPRVLLATVPYAAKAADATTLGGLPASAFVLAGSQVASLAAAAAANISPDASSVTTTGGTSHYVSLFTGASTIANSEIYDTGTSVGVGGVPNASAKLDVKGSMIMRGNMIVSRSGNATATKGYPSYGFDFFSNVYNSSTKTTANPYFALESEPAGNNTSSPSATFNLRYSASGTEAETGFYINPTGVVHFASEQTFPGAVTSVGLTAPVSDFTVTGSPITGAGAVNLTWNTPPTSANTGSAIIKRDSNGGFVAGAITANSLAATGALSGNTLTVFGQSYMAGANLAGPVGIGTNAPAALLNLNQNNNATSDFLLLGNTSSKGLQLRDNGTAVDIESIGVPLNINYVTEQPTYINPNGGPVVIDDNRPYSSSSGYGALIVGTIADAQGNPVAATLDGDVQITGTLDVNGSKDFRIDHPMDPANKYLTHAAIESSEVLNQYSGNITTDELGLATVHLPDWFEVENTDYRYQLTVIGGRFAQAVISKEVEHNQFTINTNAPAVKVSWQVTARRNDAYIKAHPLVVEQDKPATKRGTYMEPELYGQPESKRTGGPRRPSVKGNDSTTVSVTH
jgi:hypothetical protein